MFRHVVLFRWTPEATDAQKAAIAARLAELPGHIPELAAFHFGPDHGLAAGNWDYVVVGDFADEAGYLAYRDHPAHQDLIARHIRPVLQDRAAVQHSLA